MKSIIYRTIGIVALLLVISTLVVFWTPKNFPVNTKVHIAPKTSLSDIALTLYQDKIIPSKIIFRILVILMHGRTGVQAGDYSFKKPQSMWIVAYRMVNGDQGLERIKITIPEGSTVKDIDWILLKGIPDFDAPYFLKLAQNSEGYLFPDTYFFYENVSPQEIFNTLRKAFDTKYNSLVLGATLSGRNMKDIVTMASIVEKEANNNEDRAIIAGILWKRIDEGIPLQVDPPLSYATSNTTGYTSIKDTQIDSPYNTYKYKGLPKGPISNPGLDALRATINPTQTKYYFYLSDRSGVMHYAIDHAGHITNRDKYLNK